VADLSFLCAQLCSVSLVPDASPHPQPTAVASHLQQLKLRADTLKAIKEPNRGASHAELLQRLLAEDVDNGKAVRR
jgi:hypothetical protein